MADYSCQEDQSGSNERSELHLPSEWEKLLVEDQYEEDEEWYKVELPDDEEFILTESILPIALIGEGRFGKVYLSWLRAEGRYVAAKFMPFALAEENRIVIREQLTCRLLKEKDIDNTVKYLGYTDHVESQQRGLIFELCADISDVKELADEERDTMIGEGIGNTNPLEKLSDWTDRVGSSLRSSVVFCNKNRWGVAKVITMLRQAAEALLEVRKLGFIHRDIADRNILCDEKGNIQLADFGLAKYVLSSHEDSQLLEVYSKECFTPGHQNALAWWAPECFGSEKDGIPGVFSWNSDVYAFGMTMWQCFAHDDPFSHARPELGKDDEVADRIKELILKGKRPSLIKKGKVGGMMDPDTPDDLIALIDSCWKMDPEQRPTLVHVIKELQQIESNVKNHGISLRGGRMGSMQNYDVGKKTAPLEDPVQGKFTSQMNVSVPSSMGDPNFKQIMKQISECKDVNDFVLVYLDPLYEACLQRITKDQQRYGDHHLRIDWAKDWAERLKNQDPFAKSLNADRKVCLELLYALCNRWRPKDPATTPTVSEADIVNVFKDTRVKRILYCCLVMDRANAMYNMVDSKTNLPGMHWYSHDDTETVSGWRASYGEDRANEPTINKRLTWLFELEGLGLNDEDFLKRLMEPCRTPLAFASNYENTLDEPSLYTY